MHWRPAFLAMWVGLGILQCSTQLQEEGLVLKGRLCCEESKILTDNGCVPGANKATFSPPISANLSQITSNVSWSLEPLKCSSGYYVNHLLLDGRDNTLDEEEGKIYLRWLEVMVFKSSSDYCVGPTADGGYAARTCHPNVEKICTTETCVQKCCGDGEVVELASKSCIKRDVGGFSPEFRTLHGSPIPRPANILVIEKMPVCEFLVLLNPRAKPKQEFYLLPSGTLYEPYYNEEFMPGRYCLEYFVEMSADVAFVCREPLSKAIIVKNHLQAAGLVVSCVFLSVTIVCHLAIKRLRDIQGLCLLCHMVSLLIADVVLFIGSQFSKEISKSHCVFNGFLLQYSFLATFFWLNVMCFDVWRVIKATVKLVPLRGILANDAKKFKLYCAYAWGVPLVVTLVTIAMHFLPDEKVSDALLRPGFGLESCWFSGDYELLSYFYGLVGLLFLLNMILLGHTLAMLFQAGGVFTHCCSRKTSSLTAFNRSHLDAFWQRFSLFCLMALCWVTEILSWKIYPQEMWIPTDFINSLQGFIVFVIFMRSRKKREIVRQSWAGTVSTVSQAVRKISRTDETSVVLHVSDNQVCIANPDGSSSGNSKLTEEMTPNLDERKDRGSGDGEASPAGETNPSFQAD
ncbi:probable G-protein coupled receptor Mth-like 3 isoform X1 [Penaeus chinensis]|uniref:probable G-protein coupled receptor Mth-like 3 isoform X1 n=2 Tax=Penaeus chinensis TaxID=139456 RepID=UPI001FB85FD9|nr:probable G-protein coupled receptor Mth-like 3 isoform X1 [Penaeus chinensis]XP_047476925.1 probable G-protein coupled receptor Mth-like 3 isoform X1 [Penaeus chinensis]XP_047476926.1 probable G-protein coupled receptor Mth-like 3 isoform X1 [Penaeus chinensis]